MTVYNTGYSTLEDAWGNSYLSPNLHKNKKPKKKAAAPPPTDPICDLYEMGNSHYSENDLLSFANRYYEKHEKAKYQKPMMNDMEAPRERSPLYADIQTESSRVEVEEEERDVSQAMPSRREMPSQDYALEREMASAKRTAERDRMYFHNTREYYTDDSEFEAKNTHFNVYDIMLYVISGIILIFMMEQFVKVGMMMH